MFKVKVFAAMILSMLFFRAGFSAEGENIVRFDSKIELQPDYSMKVSDSVTVYAKGDRIRRGIIRYLPKFTKDEDGNVMVLSNQITGILKDWMAEKYSVYNSEGFDLIYIGNENISLDPNQSYTYSINYHAFGRIRFTRYFTELVWNIPGDGWVYTIDKATAQLILPENIADKISLFKVTVGTNSSHKPDFSYKKEKNVYFIVATRALDYNEPFKVKLRWPADPTKK